MSVYRMADLNIQIDNKYKYTDIVCRDYKAPDGAKADFVARASESDREKDIITLPNASEGYLEALSIYRSIANQLLDFDGFILHASVVEKDGVAYAFSAKSGTGKTTHSKLWTERYPDSRIINGDKPLIRRLDGTFYVYGTPWCGKESYQVNTRAPLRALCFIERAENNEICGISSKEAVNRILPQLLMPKDASGAVKLLGIIDEFLSVTPVYLLKCNMKTEAAEVAYNGMAKDGSNA